MMKRRTLWIVAAVLLAALAGGAAWMKTRPAAPVAKAPAALEAALEFLPSDIIRSEPGELRQLMLLSGSLRSVNQAAVKAKVAGEVREVLVREGQPVQAGQVLVRMDATEFQARTGQARGALQAARGQLEMASKLRDNNRALVAKGFISQTAFDNAASQVDIAQANVESAKSALEIVQKSLADTVIRAPIAGIVSSRTIQPGEKVSVDFRLLDVVDLGQMELEASVPTTEIVNVAIGQEVQVRVEGLATPFPGKVVRINPATQAGSRAILAYVQVDNAQGLLRSGMFGQAQLTLAKKTGVLTVPASAIQMEAGRPSVYAIENNRLVQKPVTLGIKGHDGQDHAVEIISGLDSGASVLKTNMGSLRTGALVKLVTLNDGARGTTAP